MVKKWRFCLSGCLCLIALLTVIQLSAGPLPAGESPGEESAQSRIREFPFAMQCWTFRNFTFFETLQKVEDLGITYLEAYPGQRLTAESKDLTFSHDMQDAEIDLVRKELKKHNIRLISYGVVGFPNREEPMRKVFAFARRMGIRNIMTEPQYEDFSLIEKMVKRYNVNVAIHNHPPPSKYARPETVIKHIRGLDPRIGVCADTGHWLRTGVDPVEALIALEGRIKNVHLKDLDRFGTKEAVDVPFGQGKADVRAILAELTRQNYRGPLSIEHENRKDISNPSPPVKAGMDYVKGITYYRGYQEILPAGNRGFSKRGWNHYGPGYFELNKKSGVLKSQDGMGLFWYSAKKYKDFVLELDFKCSRKNTNSGVFVRVPDVPVDDSYIYKSFEIQIYDVGKGIHQTGSVYDAEAPLKLAAKPTGEWNHFKITCKGDLILVELNGEEVLNWKAEPRGKVKSYAGEGYIGLQNHDSISPVFFKNIFVKELK